MEPSSDGLPRWRYAPPSAPREHTGLLSNDHDSMRHQQRHAAVRQQILGDAAENRLAQPAAPEGAHHDQPRAHGERFLFEPLLEIGRAHAELQSLMRNSYAVFCLKKKINKTNNSN